MIPAKYLAIPSKTEIRCKEEECMQIHTFTIKKQPFLPLFALIQKT